MWDKRSEKEDFWIKTLRTIYPYGDRDNANEKSNIVDNTCIGRLFLPLPRTGNCPDSSGNNCNRQLFRITKDEIFRHFDITIHSNIRNSVSDVRKILETGERKVLKEIEFSIIDNSCNENGKYKKWYSFVLDIIDTKLYKCI